MEAAPGTPTVGNPYPYAANEPLNKIDPLGLSPVTDNDLTMGSQLDIQPISNVSSCDWWRCSEPQDNDAWGEFPSEYTRQTKKYQGEKLRARGFLNTMCVELPIPCTAPLSGAFRPEYTAQAHAHPGVEQAQRAAQLLRAQH